MTAFTQNIKHIPLTRFTNVNVITHDVKCQKSHQHYLLVNYSPYKLTTSAYLISITGLNR